MINYLIQRWEKTKWVTFHTVTESYDVRDPKHRAMDLTNEFARHSSTQWRVILQDQTIIHQTKQWNPTSHPSAKKITYCATATAITIIHRSRTSTLTSPWLIFQRKRNGWLCFDRRIADLSVNFITTRWPVLLKQSKSSTNNNHEQNTNATRTNHHRPIQRHHNFFTASSDVKVVQFWGQRASNENHCESLKALTTSHNRNCHQA